MAHELVNVPHAPPNDEPPASFNLEQVFELLLGVVPHMPLESQISFLAMSRGNISGLSSLKAPAIRTRPSRLPLAPDVLRSMVQARTARHRYESDSAFEAKQRATSMASKTLGGSRGITKRYEKPETGERRALSAVYSPMNTYGAPYGFPFPETFSDSKPPQIQQFSTIGTPMI